MGYKNSFIDEPGYDPRPLLNFVVKATGSRSLCDMGIKVGICAGQLSRVYHRKEGVSLAMLMKFHEHTLAPVAELRRLMGVEGSPVNGPPQLVPPIVVHKVKELTRYYEANGKLWPGAVGLNGYIKVRDVVEILEQA